MARFLTTGEAALSGVTRQRYNLGLQSLPWGSSTATGILECIWCFDFQNTHPLVSWWSALTHGEVRRAGTEGQQVTLGHTACYWCFISWSSHKKTSKGLWLPLGLLGCVKGQRL